MAGAVVVGTGVDGVAGGRRGGEEGEEDDAGGGRMVVDVFIGWIGGLGCKSFD